MTARGKVQWIGLRPSHDQPMMVVTEAIANESSGLDQDRFVGRGKDWA